MASTATKIYTRRSMQILGDTKRDVENTVAALQYGKYLNADCQVTIKWDRAQGLSVATITLNYALTNAQVQQLRSF